MVEQAAMQRFHHVRHGAGLGAKLGLEALEHSIRHRSPERAPAADARKPVTQVRHRGLGRLGLPQGGNQTIELPNAASILPHQRRSPGCLAYPLCVRGTVASADDPVSARAAFKPVVAISAVKHVVARVPDEIIIASETIELIVASASLKPKFPQFFSFCAVQRVDSQGQMSPGRQEIVPM